MSKNLIFFSIFIFVIFFNENTKAQSRGRKTKISKIGFVYQTFSGDKNKSFGESTAASYGGELSLDDGGDHFRYFVKTKIMVAEGQQNFLDNTTEVKSNFKLTQISPEFGVMLYPVARKNSGLNLYVWGSGVLGYNLLDLSPISSTSGTTVTSVTTYSKLKSRDQGYSYGGGAGIGFDIIFSLGRRSGSMTMYGEAGFKEQISELANVKNFQVNAAQFTFGVGF
jgi:hypothetical protein